MVQYSRQHWQICYRLTFVVEVQARIWEIVQHAFVVIGFLVGYRSSSESCWHCNRLSPMLTHHQCQSPQEGVSSTLQQKSSSSSSSSHT
jgi:hypothetical protein